MELTITAYKLEDGNWAFDHAPTGTIRELLCNGTELVIDDYYLEANGKLPVKGDTIGFQLVVLEGGNQGQGDKVCKTQQFRTQLICLIKEDTGTTYWDVRTGMDVWLCPWLQNYFGFVPERIGVNVLTE